MKPIIVILIILLIIISILNIKIRFIIYNNEKNKLNVDLFIIPKLNIRIDLDKLIRKYVLKNNHVDLKKIINNIKLLIENKKLIKDFLKKVIIRKIKIIISYDYLSFNDIYFNVFNYFLLANIKYLVDTNVSKVIKEEYKIDYSNKTKSCILIDGMISIYSIIIVGLKNILDIIGGIKRYGTSHK